MRLFQVPVTLPSMRLSDSAHCRSRCGFVRRLPLVSSQGLFSSAPQVGQGTVNACSSAASFVFIRTMMRISELVLVC